MSRPDLFDCNPAPLAETQLLDLPQVASAAAQTATGPAARPRSGLLSRALTPDTTPDTEAIWNIFS